MSKNHLIHAIFSLFIVVLTLSCCTRAESSDVIHYDEDLFPYEGIRLRVVDLNYREPIVKVAFENKSSVAKQIQGKIIYNAVDGRPFAVIEIPLIEIPPSAEFSRELPMKSRGGKKEEILLLKPTWQAGN